MYPSFGGMFSDLPLLRKGTSRSINGENRNGEKGAGCQAASKLGPGRKGSPSIRFIPQGETATLADIHGCGVIQHIWISIPDKTAVGRFLLRDMILRMYWDNESEPSVECPIGDFFLNGFGRNYVVNSLPMAVNPKIGMNCFLPLPFRKEAKITLENQHAGEVRGIYFQIDYVLLDELPADAVYLHAQWRRQKITEPAKDFIMLDNVKGEGHYVGTHFMLSALERYWWGEGEIKFYIDGDEEYPTQCSTGTEDYIGGSHSFGGELDERGYMLEKTFCTPFMGYPFYSRDDIFHNDIFNRDVPPMRGFYRWHLMDPVLFKEDLRVEMQQIGCREDGLYERQDDVASVCYWYQTEPHNPFPKLPEVSDRWPR